MAFCKYCGSQIHDDSVFCSSCGKRLNGSAQSAQYPPPPEPERPKTETAEQRAQRYQSRACRSNVSYEKSGGGPSGQTSPKKYVIPSAIAAFIAVMLIINSVSSHSSGSGKKVVLPTPPLVSISIPPELFNVKPTIGLPESTPEPTVEAGDDEQELFENVGNSVLAVLNAITGRSDYILGSFEPLIGVTDVNDDGSYEILAVYETVYNDTYQVRYDVWHAESQIASRIESEILFFEVGGNGGKLHLMQDSNGDPYVVTEEDLISGESFNKIYCFYKFTENETELEIYLVMQTDGRYDTDKGGIAEQNFYTYYSDRVEISAEEYKQYFDKYTTVYSLDILSGEYDWDNTLSFDWAYKAFGQAG